jgi:Mitochondrial ribosomal protein L27
MSSPMSYRPSLGNPVKQCRMISSTSVLCGAVRRVLTSKKGNKNFYKGSRTKRMGIFSRSGNFITQDFRLRQFEVPLFNDDLQVYISPVSEKSGKVHSCVDYFKQEKPEGISDLVWKRCLDRAVQVVERVGNFKDHKSFSRED